MILEGATSKGADDFKKNRTNLKHSAARKREVTEAGMRNLIWTSVEAFVKLVFKRAPFEERRPKVLNRHWMMHGRAGMIWARRKEAIRLFHALDTVSATVDRPR